MQYVIYVLILLALIIIVRNIRVVQQSKVMIIERLGKYLLNLPYEKEIPA